MAMGTPVKTGPGDLAVQGPAASPPNATIEELIRANLPWLRGWVGARLRGPRRQDADDLCQDIFLKAIRGRAALRDPSKFPAWLYRIARNVLMDHLRRQKIRERELIGVEVDREDPRGAAVDGVEREEELQRALQALLLLPERYREPMLLRHVRDLSYQEIASILGISENAVQVRIFRARQMLRESL
jgi:RNA polymerase sigma-70 factor (ECF subfamily)